MSRVCLLTNVAAGPTPSGCCGISACSNFFSATWLYIMPKSTRAELPVSSLMVPTTD